MILFAAVGSNSHRELYYTCLKDTLDILGFPVSKLPNLTVAQTLPTGVFGGPATTSQQADKPGTNVEVGVQHIFLHLSFLTILPLLHP